MIQSSSRPARADFGFRLVVLARRWRHAIDSRLHAAGLTDATWRPLIHLHRLGDGTRQKELAASLGMDGSGVVRLLDVLAAGGLLIRLEDPADGRAKTLHLTADGRRIVTEVQNLLTGFEEHLLSGVSDFEIADIIQAFDRIEAQLGTSQTNSRVEP